MRNQHVTPKPGFIVCATLGLFLLSGGIGTMALADETIPEGFKKGELAPEPPADVIEAGKRVYFTKCVWCHGVDGAGDGPGADRLWPRPRNFNQGTFKIRHTASGELPLYTIVSGPLIPAKMTFWIRLRMVCQDLPCLHGRVFSPKNSGYKFWHS